MKSAIRKNTSDLDKLQQYGRRENVRINGMPEEEGENLRNKIIKLGQVTGVDIRQGDNNVVHRSGPKGGRPHQVICRFISRDTKSDLLKNKEKFNDSDNYKNAFIHEDLTPFRARLFNTIQYNIYYSLAYISIQQENPITYTNRTDVEEQTSMNANAY